MKISQIAAAAALGAMSLLTATRATAQSTTLTAPVGWLSTSANILRSGLSPTVNWNISYPSIVTDYVDIVPPSTVKPLQKLDYKIRVLGAGVTSSYSDGSNLSFVPTEALFSFNGGSYNRIFYGTNNNVEPSNVVINGTAKAGEVMRFGGRYFFGGAWSSLYTSTSGTNNVRTLVNGDYPPTTYSLANAPTLENFIKPYLDASGRVAIGPMDVIVFMELTHTDAQSTQMGYDCQDMVLLVTFEAKN